MKSYHLPFPNLSDVKSLDVFHPSVVNRCLTIVIHDLMKVNFIGYLLIIVLIREEYDDLFDRHTPPFVFVHL
jgi:hypothetical protein